MAGEVQERLAQVSAGDWLRGPSVAEMARNRPDLAAIVQELESYAARRKASP